MHTKNTATMVSRSLSSSLSLSIFSTLVLFLQLFLAVRSQPTLYPVRSQPPLYPERSQSTVYPVRSLPPLYPATSQPPLYPATSQPPLYPATSEPPLYHFCSENGTENSTFAANLNRLVSSLSSLSQNPDGFFNVSVGEDTDRVNSVSLCRGDVEAVKCLACIATAAEEITRRCPNQREAIIGYDYCTVRYTNRTILNLMETSPPYSLANLNNLTGDVETFETVLRDLLEDLRDRAAVGGVRKKFAANHTRAPSFQTLYGMVQCSPDLSEQDCSDCLTRSFGNIPACCDRRIGGRRYTPSCFFRFETYRFDDAAAKVEEAVPPPLVSPPAHLPSNETRTDEEGKKNGDADKAVIFLIIPIVAAAVLLIGSVTVFLRLRRKKKKKTKQKRESEATEEINNADSLLFDFNTIRHATDSFSPENKLGQGGFGAVYKGVLSDGQLVAVKRLSRNGGQGETEFKNEVLLVAKLQHRNLVRLLGFSMEGTERLLVYEFIPNASLDKFLFDPVKRRCLDWRKRYKIIGGVARGLVYLHEDSHLRIIHRDLKASNILLDEEMTPKIADFGMARLFDIDQTTQRFTSRIVGTHGYMAPEYAMHGQFSFKTDVYSFGVLVLEIVSGHGNSCFREGEDVEDLVTLHGRTGKKGRR